VIDDLRVLLNKQLNALKHVYRKKNVEIQTKITLNTNALTINILTRNHVNNGNGLFMGNIKNDTSAQQSLIIIEEPLFLVDHEFFFSIKTEIPLACITINANFRNTEILKERVWDLMDKAAIGSIDINDISFTAKNVSDHVEWTIGLSNTALRRPLAETHIPQNVKGLTRSVVILVVYIMNEKCKIK
jgi:hypothetical protein